MVEVNGFSKVAQVSLGDAVLEQFFDLIRNGVYKAGDKLPCERDLCTILNVSRPVLREVLSVLRHLGYIETVQGGGTYISNQPLTPAVKSIKMSFEMEHIKALEVWEVRNLLETELAGLAAERAGEIGIKSVNDAFETYSKLVKSGAPQEQINLASYQFHDAIRTVANNGTMSYLLNAVSSLLSESRERTGRVKGSNERSEKEHRAIAEAITARDPEAARQAMRVHMQSVRDDLVAYLALISTQEQ